jgi:hypothetical protein
VLHKTRAQQALSKYRLVCKRREIQQQGRDLLQQRCLRQQLSMLSEQAQKTTGRSETFRNILLDGLRGITYRSEQILQRSVDDSTARSVTEDQAQHLHLRPGHYNA